MYGILTYNTGWFLWQMLVDIAYMECLGNGKGETIVFLHSQLVLSENSIYIFIKIMEDCKTKKNLPETSWNHTILFFQLTVVSTPAFTPKRLLIIGHQQMIPLWVGDIQDILWHRMWVLPTWKWEFTKDIHSLEFSILWHSATENGIYSTKMKHVGFAHLFWTLEGKRPLPPVCVALSWWWCLPQWSTPSLTWPPFSLRPLWRADVSCISCRDRWQHPKPNRMGQKYSNIVKPIPTMEHYDWMFIYPTGVCFILTL